MCTAIVQGGPLLPVYAGEIAGRCLGVDAAAFDRTATRSSASSASSSSSSRCPRCRSRSGTTPDGERYRERVLRPLPGRLAPGRLGALSPSAALRHHGPLRRDAQPRRSAAGDERALHGRRGAARGARTASSCTSRTTGGELAAVRRPARRRRARRRPAREDHGRAALRSSRRATSPDTIAAVPAIPRTLTGKKLEAPVKRILSGAKADDVAASDALVDPRSMEPIAEFARSRTPVQA